MRWTLLALLALGTLLTEASADVRFLPQEFERADVIAIERDDRDLYGFDAMTGRRASIRLEIGETILFEEARGRVGVVLTDRRALAISPGAGFQEFRYRVRERAPRFAWVEDQVALVLTAKRVLGFVGSRGIWVEEPLSPSETSEGLRVGATVGVVTTNRRALGLGISTAGFVATDLQIKEDLESISATDTLATIRTNRRILVFSTSSGNWTERDRRLR